MFLTQVFHRPRKLFYGWVIVAVSFVSQAFNSGFGQQGLGVFFVPLEQEFGWSKTALAGARSLSTVESGILGPFHGALIDKVGPRVTTTVGMAVLGSGMVLLGTVQALWAYYGAIFVVALGSSLIGYMTVAVTMNNWFRRKRTLALAISQAGIGMGGVLLVPMLSLATTAYGWRTASIIAGIVIWVVGIPVAQLVRHSPERYGMAPDGEPPGAVEKSSTPGGRTERGAGEQAAEFTVQEAIHTRAFWLLTFGHTLGAMLLTTITVHQFAHMEGGVGLSRASAALVVTVVSITSMVAWLATGLFADRFDKRRVGAVGAAGLGVGIVLLAVSHSMPMTIAYALIYGFSWGTRFPVITSLRGDYFGRKSFGRITGVANCVVMTGSFIGPLFAGALADIQGNYQTAFLVMGAAGGSIGALCFLLLRAPTPPKHATAPG